VVSLEPGLDILCSPYPFFEVKVNDDVAVEIVDINPEQGKMKGFITALANRA
jgi:ribosomal protein S1